ncbi:MAG: hypothetical protein LBB60_02640 [Desulfovibrio sp.]|jgi:hypothetical protein|nr:hypothetical protein [Desulfovibrio sp.]
MRKRPLAILLGITGDFSSAAGCLLQALHRHSPDLNTDILVYTDGNLPETDQMSPSLKLHPHSLQRNRCLPAATPLFTICPEPHFLHVGIFPSPSFQMGVFCQKYIFKSTPSRKNLDE